MNLRNTPAPAPAPIPEYEEAVERVAYDFGFSRRSFVQILGAGLLIAVSAPALAQRKGGRGGGGARVVAARIHFGKDGTVTVLAGKVEAGQGARAELTQAAAEELRVPVERVQLVLSDTGAVPNDGITAGSGSTPRTVPAVRQGAAAAREILLDFAAKTWSADRHTLQVRDGKVVSTDGQKTLSYASLADSDEATALLQQPISEDIALTPINEWKVLGHAEPRPNGRDIVTGAHHYPSDIRRPAMLYGKVLRAPTYKGKLTSIDLSVVKAMKDVVIVQDEQFVGVAAPTTFAAETALEALAKTAKWDAGELPPSQNLAEYLQQHAQNAGVQNALAEDLDKSKKTLRQQYYVPYAQHAPLEPRAAVAEWVDDKLTVWTGTQNPFGCRDELTRAFHLPENAVRVVVPDFGAGYGGKHSGEVGVEAARLAKAAGKPVSLRWTRAEEFTWAYFRPAAVINIAAGLDDGGRVSAWQFVNINSGRAGIDTPYRSGKNRSDYVESKPPLRHGSYRALAATANNFAREVFMDELAAAAGTDALEFRLAHLENPRLRGVLQAAALRFGWKERLRQNNANSGIGLACGTEKGSYVAACVAIEIDPKANRILVRRVTQAFECGAIINPTNLLSQVQGAILMGLGPALREEVQFADGEIQTTSFRKYPVPRFEDLPELDVQLLNRPEFPSAGAGETPIIAIAPAIANAVFRATGQRLRSLPLRLAT